MENKKEYNFLIIGCQGAGKSALAKLLTGN